MITAVNSLRKYLLTGFSLAYFLSFQLVAETDQPLRLGITTTTAHSGLIKELNRKFTQDTYIPVQTIVAGSGQILRNAAAGDLDIVLVHSPAAELEFMQAGLGIERILIMSNDFVLLGPANDPAGLTQLSDIQIVMQRIATSQTGFTSRGDDSGTHQKELELWQAASVTTQGDWYIESGVAMAQALLLANGKQFYILSDRATYLSLQNDIDLQLVFEAPQELANPYHLILPNFELIPSNHQAAKQYKEFLLSDAAASIIRNYKINEQVLFNYAHAIKTQNSETKIITKENEQRSNYFLISAFLSAAQLIFDFDQELYDVVKISLQTSLIAVLLASLIFVPIGILIGLHNFKGKQVLLSLLNTAMALPTVIVGLVLYGLINRQGLLGEFGLLYSPIAMILGQCVLIAPIICNLSIIAVSSTDKRLLQTCEALGAKLAQKIIIYLSEARVALMAAVVTGFGRAIGEVGIAMMLGGNIHAYTRTMTTAIALETSKGEFEFALALGIVLLMVALIVNVLLQFFQRKS